MVNIRVLKLVPVCSLVLGSLLAVISPNIAAANPGNQPLLMAQYDAIGCQDWESTFVETETENYWVYICGGDYPETYVGVSKSDPSNSIRVDLNDYDPQGDYFEAVNGDVSYILAKTPRGMFLTVTQGTDELLREPVLQPW